MLQALAQTTYTYTTTTTNDEGALAAFLGLFTGVFLLIVLPLLVFQIICLWKTFEKAGVEGWKAIIPFYNGWVLAEIAGRPGWWGLVGLLSLIPIINFVAWIAVLVVYILIAIDLSKSFGKDSSFAVLLILLPVIGFAVLAFGDSKYVGPGGKAAGKPSAKAEKSA